MINENIKKLQNIVGKMKFFVRHYPQATPYSLPIHRSRSLQTQFGGGGFNFLLYGRETAEAGIEDASYALQRRSSLLFILQPSHPLRPPPHAISQCP